MKNSPFRHLGSIILKNRPIQLTLFLTKKCNARCNFCFYLFSDHSSQSADELSLAEIKKISANFGNLLWLAFSGGEIFLRKDLAEIASVFYQKNNPAIILLPTNGLLPETIYATTESILRRCPNSTVVVKISLDGKEETHDSMRGVQGAHQKALQTYNRLTALLDRYDNFELGVNTVFCAENQAGMLEHMQSVNSLTSCKTHTVSLIRGDVGEPKQKEITHEKYHETIIAMEENLKKAATGRYRFGGSRLKAAQDILQRRFIYQTVLNKKQVIPCFAGRLTLVITENGDVFPCESFTAKLGNLREENFDLQHILRGPACKRTLASIKRQECYCHHECYMMMNILFNPRQYPTLFKEYAALWGISETILPKPKSRKDSLLRKTLPADH